MERILRLFEQTFGATPDDVVQLPIAGSNRKYFRLQTTAQRAIAVIGTSVEENVAFCQLAEHFHKQGIAVPAVYAHTDDYACYLQEDLGDDTLFAHITASQRAGCWQAETVALLEKTMAALPAIQFRGARDLDFAVCYPQSTFDHRTVMWDLNYFKYNFLKALELDFREDLLEDDFERFAQMLLHEADGRTFLYRDFQSRNVMIKDGEPYFIDFQGGRRGPIYYDVASFLWQAKANFPSELREHLIDVYLQNLQPYCTIDEADFRANLQLFVLFRTLQVLGAYGFRGYFERKAHFLQSIPFAIDNLKRILPQIDREKLPYLHGLLEQMVTLERFKANVVERDVLTVRVFSFAYPKGIPDDASGNGGGYVFDCRAIHNPGRYEPYKRLTGTDSEVIEFLERNGEITAFLQSVYALADAHVERYLKRGFKHLMFSFGCTGGQHRSVYSAQHVAEHLARKYPIRVELCHREQWRSMIFENGKIVPQD